MNDKKIKIGICVPTYRSIPEKFWICYNHMICQLYKENKYDIELISVSSQPTDKVRNMLVKEAINRECDYVWFIDDDMLVNKVHLEVLLSLNQDICAALTFQRERPHPPAARKDCKPIEIEDDSFNIVEVDEMGAACMLIKINVFKKMKFPWFKREWKDDKVWGEDLYFANYARRCGFKIYVHTGLICDHYGTEITYDIFKYYRDLLREIKNE